MLLIYKGSLSKLFYTANIAGCIFPHFHTLTLSNAKYSRYSFSLSYFVALFSGSWLFHSSNKCLLSTCHIQGTLSSLECTHLCITVTVPKYCV